MKLWQLIAAGVLVHVVLFYSIFDIYFTSPLVHGMTPSVARVKPPAKRLVLFVADGLRADKFFELGESGRPRAPYLRSVIETEGAWGVSHTRVPTESRPGHVALIAGFYEDVSAVAKGWKENPVEFDSVFNESRFTWSWGSPDILPMFAKGASGSHVMISTYPPHFEDFAHADMTQMDTWVFREVKRFFESAEKNATLKADLKEDKLVFFLHLLGIDTTGHSHKPYSDKYTQNIKVVDDGIQKIVDLLENFYGHDGKTAYVMTADHGMTDWGSHGAGHPSETHTPLVAWGAGIRKARTGKTCGEYNDNFCKDWKLQDRSRVDVDQADVAPLMSFLIGVPYPLNSVGVLRVDYLSGSDYEKSEALFTNAQQIVAQYQVKMTQVKERTISATFRPFPDLLPSRQIQYLRNIRKLIDNGLYQDSINDSKFLIRTALEGLRYYQTYDRVFLGVSIALGFLGWMGYVLSQLISRHTSLPSPGQHGRAFVKPGDLSYVHFISAVVTVIILLLLYIQSLPWTNYFYCLLPVVLWMKFAEGWHDIRTGLQCALRESAILHIFIAVVLCILGLEILVQSFFRRELLSLGLVSMGLWACTTSTKNLISRIGWIVSCVVVAMFPLLPVVGKNANYGLVLLSGCLALPSGVAVTLRLMRQPHGKYSNSSRTLHIIQLLLIGMATGIVKVTSDSIENNTGSPFITQLLSWGILIVSPCLPLLSGLGMQERLASITMALVAPYLLMSITYESLFLLSLICLLYFWLQIEFSVSQPHNEQDFWEMSFQEPEEDGKVVSRCLEVADLRRAFFFSFLVSTAFFGTGNIASINSFDPASVYCFLTVFNPFVMGGLLMCKVVLPFVLVTCAVRAIQVVTRIPLRALMLLILIMSDFLGLHFFFLVQDYGSWLDIGTSISHYIIVMAMITFVMLLMGVSQVLTHTVLLQSKLRTKAA